MRAETRPHEAGFGSNRVSAARGEYVPAPCTHRPSKHPSEVRMRPCYQGQIWASQGGLSRNKVAVGESAAGSPPNVRDPPSRVDSPFILIASARSPRSSPTSEHTFGPPVRSGTFELPRLTSSVGLADRGGLIAQRQSASFARRMPWVQIPLSPCQPTPKPCPLYGLHGSGVIRQDRCTIP